jgi:hypothetical protein
MVIYSSCIFEYFLISIIMFNFIDWYLEGVWCNSEMHHFFLGGKLSVIVFWPPFSPQGLHRCYIYFQKIFSARTCITTIIISNLVHYITCWVSAFPHPDLIKFPYFTDLTSVKEGIAREWKEAPQRQGEDRVTLRKTPTVIDTKDRFTCFSRAWNQSSFCVDPSWLDTGLQKLLSGRLFPVWLELYFVPSRRI